MSVHLKRPLGEVFRRNQATGSIEKSSVEESAACGNQCPIQTKLRHIAIIMDGNRRWATQHGLPNVEGHRRGAQVVRDILAVCEQRGIKFLSLFAFSSENWNRPQSEVNSLMRLFSRFLASELDELDERGVRLRFIGQRSRLSQLLSRQMDEAEHRTASNRDKELVIAVDYGGRWDIAKAASDMARDVKSGLLKPEHINVERMASYMCLADLPPPDLCIRTGGEMRISNFMLWQIAYAEFYFADCLWPDFDEQCLLQAIEAYNNRKRRFGE